MSKERFEQHGKIIVAGILIGVVIFALGTHSSLKLSASFLDDASSDQIELTDIFDGKILENGNSNYKIDISEFSVPEGRINTDILFKINNFRTIVHCLFQSKFIINFSKFIGFRHH